MIDNQINVVETRELSKKYGQQFAVDKVNMHIKKAQFMDSLAKTEVAKPLLFVCLWD